MSHRKRKRELEKKELEKKKKDADKKKQQQPLTKNGDEGYNETDEDGLPPMTIVNEL